MAGAIAAPPPQRHPANTPCLTSGPARPRRPSAVTAAPLARAWGREGQAWTPAAVAAGRQRAPGQAALAAALIACGGGGRTTVRSAAACCGVHGPIHLSRAAVGARQRRSHPGPLLTGGTRHAGGGEGRSGALGVQGRHTAAARRPSPSATAADRRRPLRHAPARRRRRRRRSDRPAPDQRLNRPRAMASPRRRAALALALAAGLAAALAPPRAAAAAPAPLKGQQCAWAGALCDLSYSYLIANLPALLNATAPGAAPPAPAAPAAALLRAAARDAACAAAATAEACRAAPAEHHCEWMDAEVGPGGGQGEAGRLPPGTFRRALGAPDGPRAAAAPRSSRAPATTRGGPPDNVAVPPLPGSTPPTDPPQLHFARRARAGDHSGRRVSRQPRRRAGALHAGEPAAAPPGRPCSSVGARLCADAVFPPHSLPPPRPSLGPASKFVVEAACKKVGSCVWDAPVATCVSKELKAQTGTPEKVRPRRGGTRGLRGGPGNAQALRRAAPQRCPRRAAACERAQAAQSRPHPRPQPIP
jgi:hypothetical protein